MAKLLPLPPLLPPLLLLLTRLPPPHAQLLAVAVAVLLLTAVLKQPPVLSGALLCFALHCQVQSGPAAECYSESHILNCSRWRRCCRHLRLQLCLLLPLLPPHGSTSTIATTAFAPALLSS